MSFTVMSWNVKQFRGASAHRTRDVAEMIRDQDPDVLGPPYNVGCQANR